MGLNVKPEQKYGVWITPKDKGKWLLDHTKSLKPWSGSLKEAESYASEKGSLFPEFVYEVVALDFTVEKPPETPDDQKYRKPC